jgi:hypothetical protein
MENNNLGNKLVSEMTLREHFAIQVFQALIAGTPEPQYLKDKKKERDFNHCFELKNNPNAEKPAPLPDHIDSLIPSAVEYADALIQELSKLPDPAP